MATLNKGSSGFFWVLNGEDNSNWAGGVIFFYFKWTYRSPTSWTWCRSAGVSSLPARTELWIFMPAAGTHATTGAWGRTVRASGRTRVREPTRTHETGRAAAASFGRLPPALIGIRPIRGLRERRLLRGFIMHWHPIRSRGCSGLGRRGTSRNPGGGNTTAAAVGTIAWGGWRLAWATRGGGRSGRHGVHVAT